MSYQNRTVALNGIKQILTGNIVKEGSAAPDFKAVELDMSQFEFSKTSGKIRIISAVGSLDTSVCDRETRRFNEEAAKLGSEVEIITISMDLPFAQRRWCGAAGIDKVKVLSDYRDRSFGHAYGVLIEESKLLARAVFIVDRKGILRYLQLVDDISHEPDYQSVLQAAKALL
jgi:thiol peroxidase